MTSPQHAAETEARPRIACFAVGAHASGVVPPWVGSWRGQLAAAPLALSDDEQEALARVVPLLVCGEQSAISVFGGIDVQRADNRTRELHAAFARIEWDESGHEAAWQELFAVLPEPADLHRRKRQAQLFFARLGRCSSIAEHFAQVSQLDSVVGVMMWFLERSAIARDPRIRQLATQIKRDEARHVSVSRKYAAALDVPRDEFQRLGVEVRAQLAALLAPAGDALEAIGIDTDAMFRRINRTAAQRLVHA